MGANSKGPGIFKQIIVAVVIAILVGGTAPWWWKEFFGESQQPVSTIDRLDEMDRDDLLQRQQELEDELRRMRHEMQSKNTETPERSVDLSGTWNGNNGISYIIQQSGDAITIQEVNPFYGITAAGKGTIRRGVIDITYLTAMNTRGRARLKVSANGRQLSGTFTDLASGFRVSATLVR